MADIFRSADYARAAKEKSVRCANEQHAWSIAPGQDARLDLWTCSQCGATRNTHPQITLRNR